MPAKTNKRKTPSRISLDTETTGVDFHHDARPFLVTTCDPSGELLFWEWDVDPETRQPIVPPSDLEAIRERINSVDELVLQNPKFDLAALDTLEQLGIRSTWDWPWHAVRDTLLAGHLLASNKPHDLTSMALQYLRVKIDKYEAAVEVATKEARNIAKTQFPKWRIATKQGKGMPSAKDKTWKYDMWLPRAIANELDYPERHPWWTVTSDYANTDSSVAIALWAAMEAEIERRGLRKIYNERLRVLPVAYRMEKCGITASEERLNELRVRYKEESEESGRICVNIAKDFKDPEGNPYELTLPKTGANNSLRTFIFDVLKLPVVGRTDTGAPSLDKDAKAIYLNTLPPRSKQLRFMQNLADKASRDTAIQYMDSYERFWVPLGIYNEMGEQAWQLWHRLHPNLNPTGTNTLRWSSNNPNEQNISKKEGFNLRYPFGPAPGREWWSCDAKNIELRIPAYESGEEELIALFERPDESPFYGSNHMLVFSILWPELWGAAIEEVGLDKAAAYCKKKYASTNYQWTKNGNFAVQYGAVDRPGGEGTADIAYHKPGGQRLIASRFSKQDNLNQQCISHAERFGYVETMPDKTVDPERGYPLLCTRSDYGKIKPTVPLNYHVQGTAMWWMQGAMIRCDGFLQEINRKKRLTGYSGYHLVMQVHDELVFDFPAGEGSEPWKMNLPIIREVQRLMEQGGDNIGLPTPVSCEYHATSWSEGVGV